MEFIRYFFSQILRFINVSIGYIPFSNQVIRFVYPKPITKTITYSKSKFLVDTKDYLDWSLYYNGFYRPRVSWFILRQLPKLLGVRPVIFDIGAANGCQTILLAEVVGTGTVVAIECHAILFEKLKKEVLLNGYENKVLLVNAAIASNDGKAVFYFPEKEDANQANGRKGVSGDNLLVAKTVETKTFKTMLSQYQLQRVDMIRIDIQGYEEEFFKNNEDILRRDKPVLSFMVNHKIYSLAKSSIKEAYHFLKSLGYNIYTYELFLQKWGGYLKEVKPEFLDNLPVGYNDNWVAINSTIHV